MNKKTIPEYLKYVEHEDCEGKGQDHVERMLMQMIYSDQCDDEL